jgi:signal transduction histidine kinase/CheY-like chemotaxis protein
VLLGAMVVAYSFALLVFAPGDPAIAPSLLIAALNLAAGWLFLLNLILNPQPSALRWYAALISDVILLSILLAVGAGLTAALALVYCYIAISAAEHRGPRALAGTIVFELAAFGTVATLTPFWSERPLLPCGLALTIVLLSVYVGAVLHRLGVAKSTAERANSAKNRFLSALSDDLRGPLRTIARAGGALDRAALDPEQWDMMARMRLSARSMLLQLDDMLNYIRIDGGTFVPETRSFDLYRLANGAVAALRAPAAERGIALALRIDPRLPYQLRGWPHQLRQILICLMTNAIRHSGRAKVRVDLGTVALDPAGFAGGSIMLRLAVASTLADHRREEADEVSDDGGRPPGLAVADRLVRLMGGRLAVATDALRGLSLAVELPFAVDQASLALPLDLAHLPVLIVTRDSEFVGDLIEPLEAWRGDPRWIGAGDAALAYLDSFDHQTRRPLLVVDGRGDVLQVLSWTHGAIEARSADPPYVLFVADEARIDSVIGLADGEFDGVLPAPFTHAALRCALHALRVEPADWFLTETASPPVERPVVEAPPRRVIEQAPPPAQPAINETAPLWPRSVEPPSPLAGEEPPEPDEPVRLVPASRPVPREVTTPARRPRQILVAAGNPANRKILGSILARAGHIVQFAEDADEARQGLETRDVDALLLDLTGYVGSDYGAARHCRRARPTLPIIALTGDKPEIAERRARDAGIDAVLPKPVEPRRLVAALSVALDAERDRPEASGPGGVVTELASHPRFENAAAAVIDEDSEPEWAASREGEAFQGLIDAFRVDSARIVTDIDQACGAGDVAAFEAAVQAMHICVDGFGAPRVREALGTIRAPTPAKLRLQGGDFVRRIEKELTRLDAALVDYLKTAK